jgi:hypothetical protein
MDPGELALWRVQYEELYKSMVNKREQFMAWKEELALLDMKTRRSSFGVAEQDLLRYREVIKKPQESYGDEAII